MKRLLIFKFEQFEAHGGAEDFIGSVNSFKELQELVKTKLADWEILENLTYINILDSVTETILERKFIKNISEFEKEISDILKM